MQIKATTVAEYLARVLEERREAFNKLRQTILENLPEGFLETINYGMIGYVVPHELYPPGYHCEPKLPLPFASIASQKNFIALYHSGIYASPELKEWFISEYPRYAKRKLDMGKSCIRFKNMDYIPFDLIGRLMSKMTPQDMIELYEKHIKKNS
ncbi:MAG: DUF1801 domain-containing protein [Calditrichia bacterium]